jgi:hypothetical protein
VTAPPVVVPIGHSCPSELTDSLQHEAAEVCGAAVRALGIHTAVCNADLIETADGVRMLEIGARTGATGLPEIIELHHGLNLYDVVLAMALADCVQAGISPGQASAMLVVRAAATGKLVRCRVPQRVAEMKQVLSVSFDYAEGTPVREFQTGPDRIGDVFVVADNAASAEELAEQVVDMLDIEIAPCN